MRRTIRGALLGAPLLAAALSAPAAAGTPVPTVRAGVVNVDGHPETALVNRAGLPLYVQQEDSAGHSRVPARLAALWPPLTASDPAAARLPGKVAVVRTAVGDQVTYDGYFLYTFVVDTPGFAKGQGLENFVVATPDLSAGSPLARAGGRVHHT